jgi:cytochrome c2
LRPRKRRSPIAFIAAFVAIVGSGSASFAGDPEAGKIVFETRCHGCHAAPPYIGRVGEANLPKFLANPRRFNPKTAMTFPGLRSKKDIDDVIAFLTRRQ